MDASDAHVKAVFRHLVQRNAINFHAETYVSGVVLARQADGEILVSAEDWLNDLQNRKSSKQVELPVASRTDNGASTIRRALLLVGSPKRRNSTSKGPRWRFVRCSRDRQDSTGRVHWRWTEGRRWGGALVQKAGQTAGIRKSLDLAAEALAAGQAIPKAAQDILGKPTIPHWVYRMLGGLGWIWRARRSGVEGSLKQEPYR